MARECHIILFSGRVQGVGFRQTTIALAEDMPLGGTVRNLSDGRVELTVEGSPTAIEQLVTRLREQFGSYIRNVDDTIVTSRGFGGGIQITW